MSLRPDLTETSTETKTEDRKTEEREETDHTQDPGR